TPLENDHVRFSWLVSIAILIAVWLGSNKTNQMVRSSLFIIAIWLAVFLHILAARTGLLCFFLVALSIAVWLIIKKLKTIYGITILAILVSLPFTAYYFFPTFQNRVKYFLYDLPYFKEVHYLPQTTDAVR